MIEGNVLDFIKSFNDHLGLDDGIDKLAFKVTPFLFFFGSIIVTCAAYFNDALSCFIANAQAGSGFDKYVNNYCWTEGTIILPKQNSIPSNLKEWEEAKNDGYIYYYQWIPFCLAIQCIMLLIPYIIWKYTYLNRSSCDFTTLLKQAKDCQNKVDEESTESVRKIAEHMEQVIYSHRDNRTSGVSTIKRGISSWFGLLIPSKRQATHLVSSYLFVKILYMGVIFFQIFIIQSFFGLTKTPSAFVGDLYNEIIEGNTLHNTTMFPKVSFCHLGNMKHPGFKHNSYVTQCILSVNMLAEKVYLALYCWLLLLTVIVFGSLMLWLYRCLFYSRVKFIKKILVDGDSYSRNEKHIVHAFVTDFLRHNGVFMLRMFQCNMGPYFTHKLINQLWIIYRKNYVSMNMSKAYPSKKDIDSMATLPKFNEDLYCEKMKSSML